MDRPAARRAGAALVAALAALPLTVAACDRPPERSAQAYCAQVVNVQGFDSVLAGGDAGRTQGMLDQLRALQQVAPPEVEPQVHLVADIADELHRTLGTTKDPDQAAQEVFARHQGDVAAITAAGAQIEAYTQQTCNVTLNATGTVPATSGSAPASVTTAKPAVTTTPSTAAPTTAVAPTTTKPTSTTRSAPPVSASRPA